MRSKKPSLIWDDWNRDHIKKHNVTVAEVEEVYAYPLASFEAKNKKQGLLAKIKNGRILAIFLSFEKQKEPYVVSARDAGDKERRIVYDKTQTK